MPLLEYVPPPIVRRRAPGVGPQALRRLLPPRGRHRPPLARELLQVGRVEGRRPGRGRGILRRVSSEDRGGHRRRERRTIMVARRAIRRAASGNGDGEEANHTATPIAVVVAEAVGAASEEKKEIGRERLPSLSIIAMEATTMKAITGKADRITENQGGRRRKRRMKRKDVD